MTLAAEARECLRMLEACDETQCGTERTLPVAWLRKVERTLERVVALDETVRVRGMTRRLEEFGCS